jgi:putative endonuclease
MWYIYILLCDQKTFYVGITNNIFERLSEHKNKKSLYTKKFSDIKLVYQEEFRNKTEAARREKQLKGWSRKKKIALIGKACTEIVDIDR